jgi:hypothetical protein
VRQAWVFGDPAGEAWLDALEAADRDWWQEALTEFLSTPSYSWSSDG